MPCSRRLPRFLFNFHEAFLWSSRRRRTAHFIAEKWELKLALCLSNFKLSAKFATIHHVKTRVPSIFRHGREFHCWKRSPPNRSQRISLLEIQIFKSELNRQLSRGKLPSLEKTEWFDRVGVEERNKNSAQRLTRIETWRIESFFFFFFFFNENVSLQSPPSNDLKLGELDIPNENPCRAFNRAQGISIFVRCCMRSIQSNRSRAVDRVQRLVDNFYLLLVAAPSLLPIGSTFVQLNVRGLARKLSRRDLSFDFIAIPPLNCQIVRSRPALLIPADRSFHFSIDSHGGENRFYGFYGK